MKRILKINSLILILVLMFNMLFPILSIATEEKVTITFKDKNLYNAILTELGSKVESSDEATYTITTTQANLETVTELYLNSKKITNISGIEKFTSLTKLDLSDNLISNIEPLASLTKLTKLYVYNNEISDITPLASLTKLTELALNGNAISDISTLASLTNLMRLNVRENKISDITPLSALTNLTYLSARVNKISDITPLSALTNLENLWLNSNKITDITPISSLAKLTKLNLGENKISNITPLSALANLEELWLDSNEVTNITPLSALTKLKVLALYNNEIQSFNPISNLTTLEQLNFSNMQISDISFLKNLANIKHLYLSNNNINDLSVLANLKELISLSLGGNPNLKDVSALASCTKLETLYLHNNDIESISKLTTLKKLKELGISGNKIQDLSVVDSIASLQLTNEWKIYNSSTITNVPSNYQTIEMIVAKDKAGTAITLPQIFVKSQDKNSKLYTEETLELVNCALSKDGTKITLNENVNEATVTIKGGAIANSKLTLKVNDGKPPVLDVKYSTIDPTNKSVTATVTSNKELKELEGWKLSENKLSLTKEYTQNVEEEITVQDFAGNEGKTRIVISNIDITAPEVEVEYSTTETTNSPVTVTVTSKEKLKEVEGWKLSEDKLILTKEYSQNTEEELTVYDLAGNERKIPIRIANIDTEDLKIEVKYSTTEQTKETVEVTIKANKKVQQVDGWVLDTDGVTLTKTYAQNAEEKVTIKDLAGEEIKVSISINNIDTTVPQAEVQYSTTETTNKAVTVTIVANEKLQELKGWKLSEDKLTLTKEYSQNVEEEIIIYDLVGNARRIPIKITNIDVEALQLEVEYSTTELTRETVKVTIKANKDVKQIEGWILEENGETLTKIYTQNKKEEVTVYDLAGNAKKVTISVDNIDTTAPEVEVKYSTTKTTTGNVTVEIIANEKIKELEGWKLSEDKQTLTKTYSQNKEEEVTIYDLAGNERKLSIKVNNIENKDSTENKNNTENKDNTEIKDNTVADSSIPHTGKNMIIITSIIFILLMSILAYIKLKKFKGIK